MSSQPRNPNEIVTSLIPLFLKSLPTGGPPPDIAIVTGKWGESFKSAPRLAIYVFLTDSREILYANGVFATEEDCMTFTMNKGWPILQDALGKKPKVWSNLLNPKKGFKPHTVVKNIHFGDMVIDLDDPEYGPCETLVALTKWNEWEKKKLDSAARHEDLHKNVAYGKRTLNSPSNAASFTAEVNRFDKFCSELGLIRGMMVDPTYWTSLETVIYDTIELNRKMI